MAENEDTREAQIIKKNNIENRSEHRLDTDDESQTTHIYESQIGRLLKRH